MGDEVNRTIGYKAELNCAVEEVRTVGFRCPERKYTCPSGEIQKAFLQAAHNMVSLGLN